MSISRIFDETILKISKDDIRVGKYKYNRIFDCNNMNKSFHKSKLEPSQVYSLTRAILSTGRMTCHDHNSICLVKLYILAKTLILHALFFFSNTTHD